MVIYIAATIAFYLMFRPGKYSNKVISGILALFWLWIGIVYHWSFFASINPAARLFGALFEIQGLIFIFEGIVRNNLVFSFSKDWRSTVGIVLMLFGPIVYPILGQLLGHTYRSTPTLGLPCPTTIFTIDALLLANRLPKHVAVIPLLWSALGFSAAISLGVEEDVSLLIAGLIVGRYHVQTGGGESENRLKSSGLYLKICLNKSLFESEIAYEINYINRIT